MNDNGYVVGINGLWRRFGKVQALRGVSLSLPSGRVVGLLGANGAGKSTLLRHIIGMYPAEQGAVQTFGVPAEHLSPAEMARIGYVHQEGELYEWMTVEQMLRYVSAYYQNWRRELEDYYVREFGINLGVRVGTMSPGERQKTAILLALCFEPELLILDEPAAALDPLARAQFLDLLLDFIQAPGRTVVISSHILSDVEKVVDHVVIMNEGQIIRDCALDELREQFCRVRLTALSGRMPEDLKLPGTIESKHDANQAILTLRGVAREEIERQARKFKCEAEIQWLCLEDLYRLVVTGAKAASAVEINPRIAGAEGVE